MFDLSHNLPKKEISLSWEIGEEHFTEDNIKYYDKDGFELCGLEKQYYRIHGFPFHKHLNHDGVWQEDWFVREPKTHGVIIDHSMILHRCDFQSSAREQLKQFVPQLPRLNFLLSSRPKWGLDMAIDWADETSAFEIIHIEMDSYDYNFTFEEKCRLEEFFLKTDWEDAAKQIQTHRDEWEHLIGFAQNDWKAKFFGFSKAERTQKSGG